jgi:hypothetical protein
MHQGRSANRCKTLSLGTHYKRVLLRGDFCRRHMPRPRLYDFVMAAALFGHTLDAPPGTNSQ